MRRRNTSSVRQDLGTKSLGAEGMFGKVYTIINTVKSVCCVALYSFVLGEVRYFGT
jgi:hypothetical protein